MPADPTDPTAPVPVPSREHAGQQDTSARGGGLAWSWDVDAAELLAAVFWNERGVSGAAADHGVDQEAVLDAECDAVAAGRVQVVPAAEVAGRVAARLPVGPGLAALLGAVPAEDLADYGLPDAAAGFRRLASWVQARELACVAQIASRSAARDERIGTRQDGRPAREACSQVSLALMLTGVGAQWWTDLAVVLSWRLAATGAALAAGDIDLARARLIADMTGGLYEEKARLVEARVLPGAGEKTTGSPRKARTMMTIPARRIPAQVTLPRVTPGLMLPGKTLPGRRRCGAGRMRTGRTPGGGRGRGRSCPLGWLCPPGWRWLAGAWT